MGRQSIKAKMEQILSQWEWSPVIITSDKEAQPKDDVEKSCLVYLCKNPLATANDIATNIECTRSKISRVLDSLEYKKLIRKVKPLNFKRGGGRILYDLKDKAKRLLNDLGFKYQRSGKCGLEAYYYNSEIVIPVFENDGFKVTWEGRSGNSNADLVISNELNCIAVELQLTPTNAIENLIRNNQATGIDKTIMICKDETVKHAIVQQIDRSAASAGDYTLELLKTFADNQIHFQE